MPIDRWPTDGHVQEGGNTRSPPGPPGAGPTQLSLRQRLVWVSVGGVRRAAVFPWVARFSASKQMVMTMELTILIEINKENKEGYRIFEIIAVSLDE
ncbi:hypothetical protein GWI33_003292 [Rhynchophorus ferrugineus]|uniref:Uncharacterized protein n=1 Tax=Rhynchophorus ferrugineus TaxID=354439 RepID=A0A834INS4_RHYFE|nr:hypothetical protein GWI33_003292 [Rhynchophorus ferrugineus]